MRPPSGLVLAASYAAGAVPFTQIAARLLRDVDLRRHGNGTVSGSGLFEVAGLGPLLAAGLCDCAKGAVGPLLAGPRERPGLAALAAAAGVAGHNWSPVLSGAGGRGISPALGALAVTAPSGAVLLLGGLAAGRLTRQTGLGCLVAFAALVPVLRRTAGADGARVGAAVLAPMLAKRLLGNGPAASPRVYGRRLLFDRDTP
ncbi:MAG TPA: glycerol-3-phosphate acyltransferase [Streptosporangiaceae bacterium]|jgi:glycerol-3-phosphate acyltransferase PlsY